MSDGLADIQRHFAAGLLDGELDPVELFRGPATRTSRRFALYRGNLAANWYTALHGAYPVVEALVGEEFFRAMARSYGRRHGYQAGDLNRFGSALADFIAGFEALADYPYMADMARLEWALHLAHYGPDLPALEVRALAGLDPAGLDGLRLTLHPNTTLLAFDWAIGRIWQAHQPQAEVSLPDSPAGPCRLIVHRRGWKAECRAAGEGEFAALQAIEAGCTLGEALEQGGLAEADFDPMDALPRWMADGLLLARPEQQGESR